MKKCLALLLVLFLFPTAALCTEVVRPEEQRCGDWAYILIDGTAYISYYGNEETVCVELPETLDGHPATVLGGNPFKYREQIAAFTVPPEHPTLAVIGGALINTAENRLVAFPRAAAATACTVPEGTVTIGELAFFLCADLTEVTIPESVTSIGEEAFAHCGALQRVYVVPDSYAEQWCRENGLPVAYKEGASLP